LKCNLNKSKVMLFEKGGKLKATERWRMRRPSTEVPDKFIYLGMALESIGDLNKWKTLAKTKGY
jgi:hypothetical protein